MIASVIVDVLSSNVDRVFDYKVPQGMDAKRGQRVLVPFANRKVEGYIIDIKERSALGEEKLKEIIRVLDDIPVITGEMLQLMYFMQGKYHCLLAEALRLFIPAELRGGRVGQKSLPVAYINPDISAEEILEKLDKRATKQAEAVSFLAQNVRCPVADLNKLFGSAPVKRLIQSGFILTEKVKVERTPYREISEEKPQPLSLTERQRAALDFIEKNSPGKFLLFGVTGSGKTEVYLRCIESCLRQGKTAILMVPEIALTPQIMRIFRSRFGESVALLHSGLSAGERFDEWNKLRRGEARIAVGARSAVFAPLENVGAIIIDEQHEQSYISESSPRYDTKDIAEFRCCYNKCSLIMGSATPLIESNYYAKTGRYKLVEMGERINGRMPAITLVDMRREVLAGNDTIFSTVLKDKIDQTLREGNQAMLFINRRGYSPIIICSSCGYIAKCSSCDVTLTYHKAEDMLKCHYCNARYYAIEKCPSCGSDKVRKSGTGTQKVCDLLKELFPSARVLRMDNDTTQSREAHLKIVEMFNRGEVDILVGTQMIAKGHDFPNVTLVGVLDADLSLYFADYKAIERTFSLITQVAGRAGRADKEGEVIVQTHTPHHYVYRLIVDYDYKGFYKREISLRETAKYPPFCRILRIMAISESEEDAKAVIKNIYDKVKELKKLFESDFIYLSAMKSPVSRIKNKYRYQILARVKDDEGKVTDGIYDIVDGCRKKNVTSYLEVNPSSMY